MAMASNNPLEHFADPHHPLGETQYRHDEAGHCSICLLKLAGHRGHGCFTCNIHLHAACAGHFKETISSFFAHPSHALKLRRSPGRVCDVCRGDCPPESFVYSCVACGFDVHPLCAMLPARAAGNPVHPGHELRMVHAQSPGGCCSACYRPLHMWRYTCCSSSVELHIACAIVDTTTAAGSQRSFGALGQGLFYPDPAGYYNHAIQGYGYGPVVQGGYGAPPIIHGSHGGPPIHGLTMTAIATFLFRATLSAVVNEWASELLSGVFN